MLSLEVPVGPIKQNVQQRRNNMFSKFKGSCFTMKQLAKASSMVLILTLAINLAGVTAQAKFLSYSTIPNSACFKFS
jgi:hypothetical protein